MRRATTTQLRRFGPTPVGGSLFSKLLICDARRLDGPGGARAVDVCRRCSGTNEPPRNLSHGAAARYVLAAKRERRTLVGADALVDAREESEGAAARARALRRDDRRGLRRGMCRSNVKRAPPARSGTGRSRGSASSAWCGAVAVCVAGSSHRHDSSFRVRLYERACAAAQRPCIFISSILENSPIRAILRARVRPARRSDRPSIRSHHTSHRTGTAHRRRGAPSASRSVGRRRRPAVGAGRRDGVASG